MYIRGVLGLSQRASCLQRDHRRVRLLSFSFALESRVEQCALEPVKVMLHMHRHRHRHRHRHMHRHRHRHKHRHMHMHMHMHACMCML